MKQSCRFILAACLLAGVIAHSARAQQTTPPADGTIRA